MASAQLSGDLPFVFVNMAMTADGKIASANRAIHSFGSRTDAARLYELRAQADAVMCGARTVEAGGADLGTGPARFSRLRQRSGRSPSLLRVIVSGSGSLDPRARVFRGGGAPRVVLTSARAAAARLSRLRSVADAVRICGEAEVDFREALRWLRREWGVERVLCEGGGELNAALFRAGLVHQLNLTLCPKVFGGRRAPTLADGGPSPCLAQAVSGRLKDSWRVGDELFLVFDVASSAAEPAAEAAGGGRCPPGGRAAKGDR